MAAEAPATVAVPVIAVEFVTKPIKRPSSKPSSSDKNTFLWYSISFLVVLGITVSSLSQIAPHMLNLPSHFLHSTERFENDRRFYLHPDLHSFRPAEERVFNWVLREELLRPDGVEKSVRTVNGLFPGPTIEVRSGDTVVVNVVNEMRTPTTLHWHGIRHTSGSNSMDGATGATQCPIPADGGTFTYRFKIDDVQAGTYWWHGHHGSDRADGLFGGFIIHPPRERSVAPSSEISHDEFKLRESRSHPKDLIKQRGFVQASEQLLLIGDWYHRSGPDIQKWYQSRRSTGYEPVPEIALLNGRQFFNCSMSIKEVHCDGRTEEDLLPRIVLDHQSENVLRLVNTGLLANTHVSIDDHLLIVLSADGNPIQPVEVKELEIAPGQRYDVRPRYIGSHGSPRKGDGFWFRHRIDQGDFMYPNAGLNPEPRAILSYSASLAKGVRPTSTKWNHLELLPKEQIDTMALKPLVPEMLPQREALEMVYVSTMKRRNVPFGYINQTSHRANVDHPLLTTPEPEIWPHMPTQWGKDEFVISTNRTHKVVMDIIVNNLEDGPHPFHLHGHSFWPLWTYEAELGWGSYRWDKPPQLLGPEAPVKRDTFIIPMRGHVVFRVEFDTPGMWMFHCHVLVHMESGMALTFNVMADDPTFIEQRIKASEYCAKANEIE